MRALDAALNAMWAMEEGALATLLDIAARQNDVTPEAIEAYRAKSLAQAEQARVRDGVAIIDVTGATFKRANMFTAMSGATSYDIIRADLQAALDDPKIKAVMFNIDSPGGEASGATELSTAIYQARGKKPIAAYVNGMGASAAYNIASAVDPGRLYVAADAMLGSIGVQMAMREPAPRAGEKTYRFVSSQSPLKNADPGTEEGAKGIQTVVDAMAQVFYEAVARNRGVDTETALKNFGKGGIFVGKDAVQAGLADGLGSFESVLAELSAGRKGAAKSGQPTRNGRTTMSENIEPNASVSAEDIAKMVADATVKAQAAERTRIGALNRIASAHAVDAAVLASAVADGSTVEAFALAVADAAAAKTAATAATALAAIKADETKAVKVEASTGDQTGEVTADQLADQILASAALASGHKE